MTKDVSGPETRRVLLVALQGLAAATLMACARPGPRGLAPDPGAGAPVQLSITTDPVLVARGIVSSEFTEVRLAASPDGRLRLWGSTNRPGPGGWNIWLSRRSQDSWSAPEPAPFNSDANDFDPAFTADGRFVYFFSNRPGGLGGDDIYRVPVTGDGFGAVEHLGPEINTPGDEWAPSPSPDGSLLLFATNAPKAKHDLAVARVQGEGFSKAALLPGAINTPDADEFDATFLADGKSIVFSRARDVETDPAELFFSTLGERGYEPGIKLPPPINTPGGNTFGPTIDWAAPQTLYLSTQRSEGGAGKLDIYAVHYALGR